MKKILAKKIKLKAQWNATPFQNISMFGMGSNIVYYYTTTRKNVAELLLIKKYAKSIQYIDGYLKFGFIFGKQKLREIKLEVLNETPDGILWKKILKKCILITEECLMETALVEEITKSINKHILDTLKTLGRKK